jgi:hypothetical protein
VPRRQLREVDVRQAGRLGHAVRDVDAESVDATVEPEAQDALELGRHLWVVPVEVGLLGREQVQVPLAVRHTAPGRTAENRRPIVRWCLTAALSEDEPLALRAARPRRQRRLKPHVLVGEVIRDDVDGDAQPPLVRPRDERVEIGERAEHRVDIARIRHVVAAVGHRGTEERREPQRFDAQLDEVVQALPNADQVADAVAVPVGEAAGIDLVEDGVAPPGLLGSHDGIVPGRACDARIARIIPAYCAATRPPT